MHKLCLFQRKTVLFHSTRRILLQLYYPRLTMKSVFGISPTIQGFGGTVCIQFFLTFSRVTLQAFSFQFFPLFLVNDIHWGITIDNEVELMTSNIDLHLFTWLSWSDNNSKMSIKVFRVRSRIRVCYTYSYLLGFSWCCCFWFVCPATTLEMSYHSTFLTGFIYRWTWHIPRKMFWFSTTIAFLIFFVLQQCGSVFCYFSFSLIFAYMYKCLFMKLSVINCGNIGQSVIT